MNISEREGCYFDFLGWNWKILNILQLNTCKEHKLSPWYFITKCNFDAFGCKLVRNLGL
jgi:hypothetical protein